MVKMEQNIGILHLSDIHVSKNNKETVKRLVELLLKDVETLKQIHNVSIDVICITGDLISSGDDAKEELEIICDDFIQPLLTSQELKESSVFIVPGNHEIKRKEVVDYIEAGLAETLVSEDKIDRFMRGDTSHAIKRIEYFRKDFEELFGKDPIKSSPFYHSHLIEIKGVKFGLACINSAWRSSGKGSIEKRKLIIGKQTVIDSYEPIKNADIKICLFHHPVDWLVDDDKSSVEKCINQFDLVLNGHIHESDARSYISYNGITLFNTCGKFDNTSDIYNGYSLISINPYNKECKVILRRYMDYPRNCFDSAANVCKDGIFRTVLGQKDDILALSYNVSRAITKSFIEYANGFFVSNITSNRFAGSFDELFIPPILSRYSEYEKETFTTVDEKENKEAYTVEDVCSDKENNILIIGKKEIGKTTLLRYLVKYYLTNFNKNKVVPFLIDTTKIDYSGKTVIERACLKFVQEFCDPEESYSKEQIIMLLKNGKCVIMFDDYDGVDERQKQVVDEFIKLYPNNKFIFAEKEVVGARAIRETPLTPECDHQKMYMCSLTKGQIRSITKSCLCSVESAENTSLVDKILMCFRKTSLPRTPFVLSLLLSLCDNSDFAPINEVSVLERFMETILQKNSPGELYSKTFDFKDKEDFLIYLVSQMNEKNKYYFSSDEFLFILDEYHSKIGFTPSETGFGDIFFKNGVLIKSGGMVTFRYGFMVEYYLAKKAKEEPDFLQYILSDKNYLNYTKELLYYAGMHRKDIDLMIFLQEELHSYMDRLDNKLETLADYNIGLTIALPEETFAQKIEEGRFSQSESDSISDTPDSSEKNLPEKIDKHTEHSNIDAFVDTLLLYGGCLKNLELLDFDIKQKAFKDFLLGLRIMLAIMKEFSEQFFQDTFLSETESSDDEKRMKNAEQFVNDFMRIALPLSIQNIALDTVGTVKLKKVIEDTYNDDDSNDFDKFFCVFTLCDLRLPRIQVLLSTYVKRIKDNALLKIIFFKLLYYYQFRYFGTNLDQFFLDTLAEINIKINHKSKLYKQHYINQLKDSGGKKSR